MFNKNHKAALILEYQYNEKLIALLDDLSTRGYEIFLHIDLKSTKIDSCKLKKKYPLISIYSKYKIYWAGFNMVEAMLYLLEKASQNKDINEFIFLSGQDTLNTEVNHFKPFVYCHSFYKIIPNSFLNRNFIHRQLFGYWNVDNSKNNIKINSNKKLALKIKNNLFAFFRRNKVIDDKYIVKSSQWIILNRHQVELILCPKNIKKYKDYFRHFKCPDEWYFSTILYNNNIKMEKLEVNNRLTYGHLINWESEVEGSPGSIHKKELFKSSAYFARKCYD